MRLSVLVLLACLCFFAHPAQAQTYQTTASSMSYVYQGGAHQLYLTAEWVYGSGGSYQWSGNVVAFELSVSAFTSQENYANGIAHSTNLYTYHSQPGQWIVESVGGSNVRVYGYRYVSLQTGYIYAISLQPKCNGEYKTGYYGSWNPFTWTGVQQTLGPLDLLNPGDD